jgi:hypothetical protein
VIPEPSSGSRLSRASVSCGLSPEWIEVRCSRRSRKAGGDDSETRHVGREGQVNGYVEADLKPAPPFREAGCFGTMKVREAHELAERLGHRLEKVRGRDVWIVRDLYSDVAVRTGQVRLHFH